MEQQNPTPEIIQDAEFRKRRSQKNWIVMGLIMGGVVLVWSVTMIKIQHGLSIAHPIGASYGSEVGSDSREPPQLDKKGDSHVQ